uniref:H/ACA ribonucleoprotein complex subunit 2 n=1 Tax=Tabanus bromius TaxID=304241 RepID=A0A0K8TR01_TABBR
MGKVKKEPVESEEVVTIKEEGNVSIKEEETYDDKLQNVNSISKPIASKKLTKKCYKLVKKAAKQKTFLRNGLKDVQTRLRKGETGIVLFAGDVTPIDIMCHLPAVCEEKGIPYVYVPSRSDLGAAMGVKRGTVSVLIREHPEYKDTYEELKEEISALPIPI